MLISSTSVFAASVGIGIGYRQMYEATEVVEVEVYETENGIEYEERGIKSNIIEEEGETEWGVYATVRNLSWTVGVNVRKYTNSFSASSGQQIIVSAVMDPTDKIVNVGIIEPDGTRRYVQGSDTVMHTFDLDQTGYYRVFVENYNSVTVEASGSYQIR